MIFTEEHLLSQYQKYLDSWDYTSGDGPYYYEYWKDFNLQKRTSSD